MKKINLELVEFAQVLPRKETLEIVYRQPRKRMFWFNDWWSPGFYTKTASRILGKISGIIPMSPDELERYLGNNGLEIQSWDNRVFVRDRVVLRFASGETFTFTFNSYDDARQWAIKNLPHLLTPKEVNDTKS